MGGNISLESYFPWPVSLSDVSVADDKKDKNGDNANDKKNPHLVGSTDNLEEDLKIFRKYFKIAINRELAATNNTNKYDDDHNDISSVVKQIYVPSDSDSDADTD